MACPNCDVKIRGAYEASSPGVILFGDVMKAPAYCLNCGKAFPWTASRLESARLLTDEVEGLSAEDREQLKVTFPDLIADTPRTVVAATRFKKISAKAGRAFVDGMRQLFVDIASETAVKIIKNQ